MADDPHLTAVDGAADRDAIETALFEIKRVIAGQDEMLERVLVCLLAGGHLLIEGVPGLAKTLTVKTVADVLGGSFQRIQFTPDLVPSDLVGTRMYRTGEGRASTSSSAPSSATSCSPTRSTARRRRCSRRCSRSMQERQVTIGKETHPVPIAVPRHGDAEPDRVGGHLPAARGPGRPVHAQGARRLPGSRGRADRGRAGARRARRRRALLSIDLLAELQQARRTVYVDPAVRATRSRSRSPRAGSPAGLRAPGRYIDFGASPRGPINLVLGARALALSARPPLRAPAGRARARKGRAAPPPGAQLRGARRGGERGPDPRPRARARRRCRSSS